MPKTFKSRFQSSWESFKLPLSEKRFKEGWFFLGLPCTTLIWLSHWNPETMRRILYSDPSIFFKSRHSESSWSKEGVASIARVLMQLFRKLPCCCRISYCSSLGALVIWSWISMPKRQYLILKCQEDKGCVCVRIHRFVGWGQEVRWYWLLWAGLWSHIRGVTKGL